MSYRAKGETLDEVRRQIEADIRYLYKCCEAPNEFEVIAAHGEFTNSDYRTGRWFSRGGPSVLLDVFVSVAAGSSGDFVLDAYINNAVVAQVSLGGDDTAVETLATPLPLTPDDWIWFQPSAGYALGLTVQARMRGPYAGSAGLNFVFVDPYTTEIC